MQYRKEKIVGALEMLGTTLLIYIHWVSFYNLMQTRYTEEYNIILATSMFMIYFIILLAAAPMHYLHLNPVTTLTFWLFKMTKLKNVI